MFSKETILQTAQTFLSKEKMEALSKAFDTTNQIMTAAQSPREALSKAGVTMEDLNKINGLLSNPLAGVVLNKFGINRDEFKARINEIKQGYPIGEQTPTMGDSSIKELSDKLKTL